MKLFAFQGIRYRAAAGDPGAQVAPPYDQIDDRLRDALHAASPHHFAHLIRPLADPEIGALDPYLHAAELHRSWLAGGVIAADATPALYPYTIALPSGSRRLGICGLVGLEAPETRVIRPHEQTLDKPLADRLALLRATRVDLEPVLLVAEDGGALEELLAADSAGEPLAVHRDPAGNRHLLHRVDAPERIATYQRALADAPAAIADGHHRYKVALRYAAETAPAAASPASAKLAVITSVASSELAIDPIHRGLEQPVALDRLHPLLAARRPWSRGAAERSEDGRAFAAAVAAAPPPALGVWPTGGAPEIWQLEPTTAPAGVSPASARLTVVLLQGALLPALGLGGEAATDGTVVYRADPETLREQVASGRLALGFWLPPMLPSEFAAAIAEGAMLPPKSTRFLPKVMSGLVWADHDARLA